MIPDAQNFWRLSCWSWTLEQCYDRYNHTKTDTTSNAHKAHHSPTFFKDLFYTSVRCFILWSTWGHISMENEQMNDPKKISSTCTVFPLLNTDLNEEAILLLWERFVVKKLLYCHAISLPFLNYVLRPLEITHLSNKWDGTAKHTKGDERLQRRCSDFSSLPISLCKSSATFDEGKSPQPVWRAMLILQLNANSQHR